MLAYAASATLAGVPQDASEYRHRVVNAVMKAVFDASLIELDGKPQAMIRTTEACEALAVVIATLIESSPPAVTPRAMRLLSEEIGKHVLAAMQGLRREREAGGPVPISSRGLTLN